MNIIAQIQGGLGNQLFQYATARALALQKESPLLLDYGWFQKTYDDVTPREPLLNKLNTKGSFTSYQPPVERPKRIYRILQNLWPKIPFIITEQAPYQLDPQLYKSPIFKQQNLYLIGYWQSYRYFHSIRSSLLSEITPSKPLDPHYQDYLDEIQMTHSAMVHVRRGDYVNLPSAAKIHGFIGLDYYHQGMNLLIKKNVDVQFFVFSDDLDWAQKNLPHQERITFIQSLDADDAVVQELKLMTSCQNHLIANSSLSWWGAWLGKDLNKTVICPKKWTNDMSANWDDLLPSTWIRI